jgi:hypothetical protein
LEAVGRDKNWATYVDDPLCHEFTPSEGIEQRLKPSMPSQEIRCPDVRVLGEIQKTLEHPRERGRVVELVEYEL